METWTPSWFRLHIVFPGINQEEVRIWLIWSLIAGSCSKSMFYFVRNHETVFQRGHTILHSHHLWMRVPVAPHPYNIWWCQCSRFWPFSQVFSGWYLIVASGNKLITAKCYAEYEQAGLVTEDREDPPRVLKEGFPVEVTQSWSLKKEQASATWKFLPICLHLLWLFKGLALAKYISQAPFWTGFWLDLEGVWRV